MNNEQFANLLTAVSADLIKCIAMEFDVSGLRAIEMLYSSTLYSLLEEEETKLWQFSTPRLLNLFKQELENGVIEFPDV